MTTLKILIVHSVFVSVYWLLAIEAKANIWAFFFPIGAYGHYGVTHFVIQMIHICFLREQIQPSSGCL